MRVSRNASDDLSCSFTPVCVRACNETVGGCPNSAESSEQNGTVPFSETVLLHALNSKCF
jgi:hypothetical protein